MTIWRGWKNGLAVDSALKPESAQHRLASDPAAHVWVSASAGTGKTTALTDRILRLLLDGNPPETILAITFTRTAAAEMRGRIARRLTEWVRMSDGELRETLAEIGEADPDARIATARGLFARVLDSPGGLQVMTIHSLAQSLLAAFPLEAGLAPGATPLDERSAAGLRQQAFAEVLEAAAGPSGARLAADLRCLAESCDERAILGKIPALVAAGDALDAIGSDHAVEPWLRRWIGLPLAATLEDVQAAALSPPVFDDATVADFAAAMDRCGTPAKQMIADQARGWLVLDAAERRADMATLFDLVIGKSGSRSFADVIKKVPEMAGASERLLAQVERVRDVERSFAFVAHAGAWLRLGMAVSARYRGLKADAAAIDYDDMIGRAGALLAQNGIMGWINAKLDRRIRHILVDEAQDTNDGQWAIIGALAADFFAGEGAHGDRFRSQFVVGDYKQAIFGFQGTSPEVFAAERRRIGSLTADTPWPLRAVPLARNFRSGPAILRLVDEVIAQQGKAAFGLPADEAMAAHQPHRAHAAAQVHLLPPWSATDAAAEAAGDDEDEEPVADPNFADALAERIGRWLDPASPSRLWLAGQACGRWATAGDVLILVRSRADIMARMVAALHARRIEVAGVDRSLLAAPIAVQDLLSLIRFVVQPGDDLALAEVLTSPLGGRDHEAIRRVREGRGSLWDHVRQSDDPDWEAARAFLLRALRMADQAGPHAFLQAILADGRAKFYARLGREAEDGLDTLLSEALLFEASQPATLQGFLRWTDQADTQVKRDPEAAGDRVRIMTIHGAKGLQAPVVVLADALRGRNRSSGMVLDRHTGLPLIYGNKERRPAPVKALWDAADAAERTEAMRLLYVALTRAEDVLVVAGQKGSKNPPEPTWHAMVGDALAALGAVNEPLDDARWGGDALVLRDPCISAPHAPKVSRAEAPVEVPDWARQPAPQEPAPARPFTPSAPAPDEAPLLPPTPGQRDAARRGTMLHRLFERLPDVVLERRQDIAIGAATAAGFDVETAAAMAATVIRVLDDPAFAHMFGPGSLAEVPIAAVVDGRAVAGTLDRLLVTDRDICLLDYKTGLHVPVDAAEVHRSYLRQMAAYRAVLAAAFPGRSIRAALLFTAGPKLIYLPDKALDEHWPPGNA